MDSGKAVRAICPSIAAVKFGFVGQVFKTVSGRWELSYLGFLDIAWPLIKLRTFS